MSRLAHRDDSAPSGVSGRSGVAPAPRSGVWLGDAIGDRNNNLNLIRILAAAAVLVSHSYPIALGPGATEPLSETFGFSLGHLAVVVFFFISGCLISESYARSRDLRVFAWSRLARIVPALAVVLVVTVFAMGPVFTDLATADYFARGETYTYLIRNLTLAKLQYDLPGVFADNVYPDAINGSLWTLFYEVVAYLGVALLGVMGWLRKDTRSATLAILFGGLVAIHLWFPLPEALAYRLDGSIKLFFAFFLGVQAFVHQDRIRVHPLGALVALAGLVVLRDVEWGYPVVIVCFAYLVLVLAYLPRGAVLGYNRLGDYSYGLYIYAFPCQQIVSALLPGISPLGLMVTAMPAALACAVLSWHAVESPALALRRRLLRREAAGPVAMPRAA